jgi:hypothetical protein
LVQVAAKAVKLLPLETKKTFVGRRGDTVEIKDPDGRATEAQVMPLFRAGFLQIVSEQMTPPTKGEVSFARDVLNDVIKNGNGS